MALINYAGDIQGRARFDVGDMASTNLVFEPREVDLVNARELAEPPTLEREGLVLTRHVSAVCHSRVLAEIDLVYHHQIGPE